MILVSASNGFFETEEEYFTGALRDQIQREFYYVNLNSNESLLLFTEKYTDYRALADTLHQFFLQQFETDCYFAVSEPVESWRDMPEEFRRLEKLLEEQFYQPGQHVFLSGEPGESIQDAAGEDSEIMEQISHDIKYKDISTSQAGFRQAGAEIQGGREVFADVCEICIFQHPERNLRTDGCGRRKDPFEKGGPALSLQEDLTMWSILSQERWRSLKNTFRSSRTVSAER